MPAFVLYESNGKIDSLFSGPEDLVAQQGFDYLPASGNESSKTHYVDVSNDEAVIAAKDSLNFTHSVDGLRVLFTGLPPGTLVAVNNVEVAADGQDDEIEFDVPGTHTIKLNPPLQYLGETLEVTVG